MGYMRPTIYQPSSSQYFNQIFIYVVKRRIFDELRMTARNYTQIFIINIKFSTVRLDGRIMDWLREAGHISCETFDVSRLHKS